MKKYLLSLLAIGIIASSFAGPKPKEGHKLSFHIDGIKDTIIFLANYYGPKQYYKDTADVDSDGNFTFEGDEKLPGGIYSVVMPDKKSYFEFIINDQEFFMSTTKGDLVNDMKVKNSEENETFYGYLQFVNSKQKESKVIKDKLAEDKDNEKLKDELGTIDTAVREYKLKIMEEHPDYLVTKIFKASQDPEVPEAPILKNGRKDSTFAYKYYKAHYLDGIDFQDERLLRTPVFHNKLDYYIQKLTVQMPDSINKEADYIAGRAKGNDEMFKYVVHYVTNTYEKSKIMGMDAVFVHMAENYYMKGEASWIDSTQLAKITDRATTLSPLLVNKKAPNIILQDTTEQKWVNLHTLPAEHTVVYFWDPGCGHCKKATPKLKKIYDHYSKKGFEVYAVCTEFETPAWKKYVIDNDLNWINVSDNPEVNKNAGKYMQFTTLESLNFRQTYDIFSTPQIYLLDKDKKILAKRLSMQQLDEILAKKFDMETVLTDEDKKDLKGKDKDEH
jgi:thiol-disulfide isomerase/thioredoxin